VSTDVETGLQSTMSVHSTMSIALKDGIRRPEERGVNESKLKLYNKT
jgi:hypothetical protein